MTEAALFYEMAHPNLGDDFLDDIRFAIDTVRERPKLGVELDMAFAASWFGAFPSASSISPSQGRLWSSPWRIKADGRTIGGSVYDC